MREVTALEKQFQTEISAHSLEEKNTTQLIEKEPEKNVNQEFSSNDSELSSLYKQKLEEKEKGDHTKEQIRRLELFLNLAIKQQKSISLANRMPHYDALPLFLSTNPQTKENRSSYKKGPL